MNKAQYYTTHAKILFDISKKEGRCFFLRRSSYDEYDFSLETMDMSVAQNNILDTPEKLCAALLNSRVDKMDYYIHQYAYDYLIEIAKLDNEYLDFFLANSKSLVGGEISLYRLKEVMPKIDNHVFCKFIKEGGKTFVKYSSGVLKDLAEILSHKPQPEGFEAFYGYVKKHEKKILSQQYNAIELRDSVKAFFSDKLEVFKDFPYMETYALSAKLFMDTPIENTIYLRLNMVAAMTLHPSAEFTQHTYSGLLKGLLMNMEKEQTYGLKKFHFMESRDDRSNYQYSHLYANFDSSLMDKAKLMSLIDDYLAWAAEIGIDSLKSKTDEEESKLWLRQYVLENHLENNTGEEKKKPRIKI